MSEPHFVPCRMLTLAEVAVFCNLAPSTLRKRLLLRAKGQLPNDLEEITPPMKKPGDNYGPGRRPWFISGRVLDRWLYAIEYQHQPTPPQRGR